MDATLKAKWVEALRSGEYEQAHMTLTNGKDYCCLGVLCQVAGLTIAGHNSVIGRLGEPAGYTPITELLGKVSHYQLSERNDGSNTHHQHSFPEIADYIEQNL